ncbi:hypothetical protein [Nocardiopsis sp. NPDC055824]
MRRPGCVRLLKDEDGNPVLIPSPDLDLVPIELRADADGNPWTLLGVRALCPGHGHLA